MPPSASRAHRASEGHSSPEGGEAHHEDSPPRQRRRWRFAQHPPLSEAALSLAYVLHAPVAWHHTVTRLERHKLPVPCLDDAATQLDGRRPHLGEEQRSDEGSR